MSAHVSPPSNAAQPTTLRQRRWSRRASALVSMLLCLLISRALYADSGVPLNLQARLLSRLCGYDRNFKARNGSTVNVLVVYRKSDPDSAFEGAGLAKAIAEVQDIGGLPFKVDQATFSDAESLAKRCRTDKIGVVYLTVGLEADTPRIASSLANLGLLTVGSSARHAEGGAVVGIGVEEARPKLVINLKQAASQNVKFKAEILSLARLID